MGVTTDVAARTREVTGVEPASGPARLAGWTWSRSRRVGKFGLAGRPEDGPFMLPGRGRGRGGAGAGPAGLRCSRGHVLPRPVPGGWWGARVVPRALVQALGWGCRPRLGTAGQGGRGGAAGMVDPVCLPGSAPAGPVAPLRPPLPRASPTRAGAWSGVQYVKLGTLRSPNKRRRLSFCAGK